MTIEQIVDLAFRIFTLVGYVLLAILAIKRKKAVVTDESTDGKDEANLIDDLLGYLISEVKDAEDKGSLLSGKSGFFKFDRVLAHAKDFCREKGIDVDTKYLEERIEGLVKLLNYKTNAELSTASNRLDGINYEVK